MKKNKVIYAIEKEQGDVKIGVTEDFERRRRTIENTSGCKITRTFCTPPCVNSYRLEKQLHSHFKHRRVKGEWFKISFETAVQEIKEVFSKHARCEPEDPEKEVNVKAMVDAFGLNDVENFVDKSRDSSDTSNKKSLGVADLVEEIHKVMEANKRNPYEVARQTELLLRHFGIPVIEDFVEKPSPWEQMQLPPCNEEA